MKKILILLIVAGMTTFLACGPSSNDKAKIEKAIRDSIKKADSLVKAHKLDSLKKVKVADSLAAVEKAKKLIESNSKSISNDEWVGSYDEGDGGGLVIEKDGNNYQISFWAYGQKDGPYLGTIYGNQIKYNYKGETQYISHHSKDDRFYSKGSTHCISITGGNQNTYCK